MGRTEEQLRARRDWGGPPAYPIGGGGSPGGAAQPHLAGRLRLAEKARKLRPLATAPMRLTMEKLCPRCGDFFAARVPPAFLRADS